MTARKESLHTYFFNIDQFLFADWFNDFNYPWEILPFIHSLITKCALGQIRGNVSPAAYLVNQESIYIGEGTVVEPGAYIQGPCYIGNGCTVRHGAYIRGDFVAGDGCVIGHGTEVKNTIVFNEVKMGHFNYFGDSVIGHGVNFGAGSKCANLRLDHQKIKVTFNGQKIQTNLKKFGAIIGDGSQIGCNSVINPGTLLGKEVFCYPCLNLGGFSPSGSIVKSNTSIITTPL